MSRMSSSSSPSAQRYAAQAKPRSGSCSWSRWCSRSRASRSDQIETMSASACLTWPPGHPRGGGVVGTPRLVDQRGEHGRQPRCVELVPQPLPQRLRGDQVHLVVDPHQGAAAFGDGRLARLTGEVAERREHVTDPVELPGDGVGALLDPALEGLRVAVELEVALRPAGVVLAVRAVVARVCAQLAAEVLDPAVLHRVVPGRAPARALARRWRRQVVGAVAQRRGQVAA